MENLEPFKESAFGRIRIRVPHLQARLQIRVETPA